MRDIPHRFQPRNPLRLVSKSLLLWVVIGMTACGKSSEAPEATQVAAKVGSSEISIHQINQVLSRAPRQGDTKEAVKLASQAALERLIDQQLAVDQAIESKLHRSPDVVAKLEAARRDVLARAYLEHVTQAVTRPTTEELQKYYDEHPALFAERRIFNLQEIRIPNVVPAWAEVQAAAERGSSPEEVAGLLREKKLAFTAGGGTLQAEQLPLDLLPRLHALKDGQNTVVRAGNSATVIRVAASKSAPVTFEMARAGIEQFLFNRRASEAVVGEIKRLRATVPIEYEGDFAKTVAPSSPTSPATPPAVSADAVGEPGSAPAPRDTAATALPDAKQIEQGLQGLK